MSEAADAPRVRMDPRIRERRVAVRRDEGRRRLRVLLALAAAVALAGAGYGVTRSPLLDVDHVRIRGTVNTTPEAIAAAGGLDAHPQLLDVDPTAAAERIERLPWVERATVVRHWPAAVEVTVLERTPLVAMAAAGGGWASVDGTGRVLDHAEQPAPGLIRIESPAPAPVAGERVDPGVRGAVAVVEALPASLSGRVTTVRVDPTGALDVVLDGGPLVQFGAATEVRAKLVALTTLLERTNLRGVRTIDVRVPTAPVLTRA
jgi:cell division protein FtsQ